MSQDTARSIGRDGKVLFPGGQIVATRGAIETIPKADLQIALHNHFTGEWGDALGPEDAALNDAAVEDGDRILSAYYTTDGKRTKFWIITEWDRSATTVLLPEEY